MNWTIISFLLFTILVAIISYVIVKKEDTKTQDGYFLGGRSLSGPIIAGSLMLTNLSTEQLIGQSGQAYSESMVVMAWEVGSAIALVLMALVFLPRYLKMGITTIPDFLEKRFDSGFRQLISYVFIISYTVTFLPTVLYSGAVVLAQLFKVNEILNVSYFSGIWLTAASIGIIGAIYAIFGGLRAVAVSDTINGVGLLVGGFLIPILGFIKLGEGNLSMGIMKLLSENPEKFNSIGSPTSSVPFAVLFTGMLFNNLYYWCTNQMIIQRALAAKNLKEGQKGVLFAGALKLLGPFFLIIPGIIAFNLFPNLKHGDLAYPTLISNVLPKPLVGLFAAVLFGAILSSFNSALNSTSTIFALNIYKPLLIKKNKKIEDLKLIKMGKFVGITLTLVSVFIAPFIMYFKGGLYGFLQEMNGFYSAPLLAIVLVGFFTRRATAQSAKLTLVFHVIVYGIYQFIRPDLNFLHSLGILFPIEVIIMVFITKKNPRKIPYEYTEESPVDMTPWKYRRIFATVLGIAVCCYYIVFSKYGIAK